MPSRRSLLKFATALVGLSLAAPTSTWSDTPVPVVATFSILGDMVERIGGDHVAVTTLVGADGDAHVYQPVPADARAVSQADILVFNGLAFEGWLHRLVEASNFDGIRVVASEGIAPIAFEGNDDHAAYDPHAWKSLANAVVYVDNITAVLAAVDPANASSYYRNRAAYVAEIKALDAEIREIVAGLPEDGRTVVTSHDAFGYFSETYGLRFVAPHGVSTESEPSAADVAALIRQIREEGIKAIFVESITDSRLLEQIANETGASIGGTLYSDSLSEPDGPASTYLDMMRYNALTLARALST